VIKGTTLDTCGAIGCLGCLGIFILAVSSCVYGVVWHLGAEKRYFEEQGYRFIKGKEYHLEEGECVDGPIVIWGPKTVVLDGVVRGDIAVCSSELVVHGLITGNLELVSVRETLLARSAIIRGNVSGIFAEMPAGHLVIEGRVLGKVDGSIRNIEWEN
jgi:hypothetical protein